LNVYFKKYLKKIGSFAPCCLVYSVLLVVNILKKIQAVEFICWQGAHEMWGGALGKKSRTKLIESSFFENER
jgi:hypothetical protein